MHTLKINNYINIIKIIPFILLGLSKFQDFQKYISYRASLLQKMVLQEKVFPFLKLLTYKV